MATLALGLVHLLLGLQVVFFDVGQGDASLVTTPGGRTILVDAGPPEAGERLAAWLKARGPRPLDLAVLSHRHLDHLGGLRRVIAELGAAGLLEPAFPHDSPAWSRLLALLEARRIPVRAVHAGERLELDEAVSLEVLAPPARRLRRTRSDVNSNSLVARLEWRPGGRPAARGLSVLFTGDAERATEAWLLAAGARLRARVLKVAHHGSVFSSSRRFLAAVRPEVAVVSAGRGNEYHHPHAPTVRRLERLGARLYRTDRDGDVTLDSDGDALTVTTATGREVAR
jgi:beta-lactamase superfamily II metal-dependent hydrolase